MSTLQVQETTNIRLYKSPLRSWKYFFSDGTPAIFANGEYTTDQENRIAELDREVQLRHPAIYIDPNEKFVSIERLDPLIGLRKRIAAEERAKVLEEMRAAAGNPDRDMGKTEQERIRPASTTDIASVTAGGDASARLMNLAQNAGKK